MEDDIIFSHLPNRFNFKLKFVYNMLSKNKNMCRGTSDCKRNGETAALNSPSQYQ